MLHAFLTRLFGLLCHFAIYFTCRLNRITVTNGRVLDDNVDHGKVIFAFWHSRLWFCTWFYIRRKRKKKLVVLVSKSRDGDYGAALVRRIRQKSVRGSTRHGGSGAIRQLASMSIAGDNLAITPDGPRGPAFRVREGVIKLAQLTGSAILPVSYDATRVRQLKSWDGFVLVKPFGRIHIAFAEPMIIPKDAQGPEIEKYRLQLEETLHELDRRCASELGLEYPHGSPADGVLPPLPQTDP